MSKSTTTTTWTKAKPADSENLKLWRRGMTEHQAVQEAECYEKTTIETCDFFETYADSTKTCPDCWKQLSFTSFINIPILAAKCNDCPYENFGNYWRAK